MSNLAQRATLYDMLAYYDARVEDALDRGDHAVASTWYRHWHALKSLLDVQDD